MVPAREIDYKCLRLLMERSTGGSPLKKQRALDKLEKAWKRGGLFIPPNEEERQKWWRCEARFMLGDYTDWSGWEYRDEWAATLWHWRDTKPYPIPPWNGQKVGHLYIIGEQGVGDEVFFSSCIPDAKEFAQRVTLECQPRLRGIFERSFAIETVSAQLIEDGKKRVKKALPEGVDAWIPLADLPRIFRTHVSKFKPFRLQADPAQIERFKAYRGRVGISWRGAQGQEKRILEAFPDAVSLQYDLEWDEVANVVPDLDMRNDLEGVFGLLANLSKVITVSTSVAHFACSLGVETHVIIAEPNTGVRGNILPWKWICD